MDNDLKASFNSIPLFIFIGNNKFILQQKLKSEQQEGVFSWIFDDSGFNKRKLIIQYLQHIK